MSNVNYEKLSRKAVKAESISNLIYLIILLTIISIFKLLVFNKIFFEAELKYKYVIVPIILLIILTYVVIMPIFEYKQWGYIIEDDRVDFTEGIYFKERTIIPISRIQHIDIRQSLLDRHYGISSIIIYTAGNKYRIPSLEDIKAEQIAINLKNIVNKNLESR